MFSSAALIAFFATAFTLIAIPGPSVMFIIGRTLSLGRKYGLITVFFNSVGHTMWMLAVAFGLGQILASMPIVLAVLKIVGALYLGYLGVQSVRHRKQDEASMAKTNADSIAEGGPSKAAKPAWFRVAREAFLVGFSNPKTAVFFIAVLPQFVEPGANFTIQFLILGLIFEIMGNIGDGIWSLSAAWARTWIFARSGRLSGIIGAGGLMIVSLATYLLVMAVIESGILHK
jgi:threonine/homoserine/homoserine lactone efflux protein